MIWNSNLRSHLELMWVNGVFKDSFFFCYCCCCYCKCYLCMNLSQLIPPKHRVRIKTKGMMITFFCISLGWKDNHIECSFFLGIVLGYHQVYSFCCWNMEDVCICEGGCLGSAFNYRPWCFSLSKGLKEDWKDKKARSILWFFSGSMCWAKKKPKRGMSTPFHPTPPDFTTLQFAFIHPLKCHEKDLCEDAVRWFTDRKIFNQTLLPPLSLLLHTHTVLTSSQMITVISFPSLNPDFSNLVSTPPTNEAYWGRQFTNLYIFYTLHTLSL